MKPTRIRQRLVWDGRGAPWWVAMVLAVLSGCAPKSQPTAEQKAQLATETYQTEIPKIVHDHQRADQLIVLTNQFEQLINEAAGEVRGYRGRVAALNSSYQATRGDYETLFAQEDQHRKAFISQALALREKMAAATTDEEWAQLRKARLQAMDANLKALQM